MRILIEEHQYAVSDIRDVIQGIDALENVEGYVSIHYVGYYYNTLLKDCVFILPKVLLKDVNGGEYRDWETDRKSTRLNSSHSGESRMPSSA